MEIRLVKNEEFLDLAELTSKMYTRINNEINAFQAVNTLVHMVNTETDFIAIGQYEDDVMVGFVTGHAFDRTTFLFTGIYSLNPGTESVKQLIEWAFAHIEEKGYGAWEADATNDNISSILEKYGANVRYTRYRKELK